MEGIRALTLDGAYQIFEENSKGSLETGKRADIVVHDVPNRYHLVYRFGVPRVGEVIAGGKPVEERDPR